MRRTDVYEAHAVLEWDYHVNGWLRERRSNRRRMEATAVQLHRMGVRLRETLGGFSSLSLEGKRIYVANVLKLKLPFSAEQRKEWVCSLGADVLNALAPTHG